MCVEWRHVCVSTNVMFVDWWNYTPGHGDRNDDRDTGTSYIYIYKNKLSVCGCVDQVTSPEKTGSGDVKTEKTKKRQKLQKKLKTNKKKS